jgi:hypothetical protein
MYDHEMAINRFTMDLENKSVYRYFKEKLGLVNFKYACKVLKCGRDKGIRLLRENNICPVEYPAPVVQFKTKLYSLSALYDLRKKLEEDGD